MTMSIAKLSAQSGLKYLFKTTMMDDLAVAPIDATTYYMKAGTPQGRWMGSGLSGINRASGDLVTETDAKALYDQAVHPDTGAHLGRTYGQPAVAESPQGQPAKRRAVVGFDLTFSVPKSVSVLWALSPRAVQNQILETHHEAVASTLKWLEANVIHTRAGRNGVARIGTKGAIAAAFDHWESRAGDPQLHTHLVIANRVQRANDGAWVTLDSRTLYKAAVAASEHYNGLLFDALHRNLGTDAEMREPAANTHNPSQQLCGIDEALIHEFSNRSRLIDVETDRLVAAWAAEHGRPPNATTIVKLRQQATLSTRAPKAESMSPLHMLSGQWQARAMKLGYDPSRVLSETIRRSLTSPFRTCDFTANWVGAAASITKDRVAAKRSTWNRWNLLAEAERVCAEVRCLTAADRGSLIDAVATAAESQSVPLNEYRYSVDVSAALDIRRGPHSVFDFHGSRLYTDATTLACEEAVMDARNNDGGPAVSAAATMCALDAYTHNGRFGLHEDQRSAAAKVLLSGNRLDAVVGPAGTGKTTTLGAVKTAWESEFGSGSVVGLAPAAASAEVLGRELAMATENVAKWLYESVGHGASDRASRFFDLERRLRSEVNPRGFRQTRQTQEIIRLAAEQAKWRFRPHQLVVVDEASMVSTIQLAALVRQARDAGAKILLVGDPAQLDAIDAGGILGWLDRQGKTVRLSTIWRFEQEWERDASLKLRSGNIEAMAAYDQHDRIQHGTYLNMVDRAYGNWQADMRAGKSSILIAADNDTVSMLNERAQADLVLQGVVDAEQTVLLSDGLKAGQGDTLIARQNDRTIWDSNGDFIRNGTMLDVVRIAGRGDSVVAMRRDNGAIVTLRHDYLLASVELGYATTAHRSQGLTVDTGHTVVTRGRLTRELLYVSMTRGRAGNYAYVSENDPLDHEVLDPSVQPSWREIVGEVLAAEGAERTAHEVRASELSKADSLERLSAEYDYLAQIAAAEDLVRLLQSSAPERLSDLQQSPSWGAAVAAWRRAAALSRPSAQRLVDEALKTNSSARDLASVIHSRLRRLVAQMPSDGSTSWAAVSYTDRPDLAGMIRQVADRMRRKSDEVANIALMSEPDWTRDLQRSVGPGASLEEMNSLIRAVAVFRDRWGIRNSVLALGPMPPEYEWEHKQQRTEIEKLISQIGLPPSVDLQQIGALRPDTREVGLTNVGWQL
ncbi:MobF family relaxase [Arthrobacter sp. efr-133-TYG-120]|uniref:MobF family relaxase n=1 Tax=Arthrobacter sp. efr-133-TYG-120 TaxID=3040280 RepID=UPI00254B159E|nr:MobF family relaxase [Arthrobacter sp. efr-133-TYG-120]